MTPRYSGISTINHWLTLILVTAMLVLGLIATIAPNDDAESFVMWMHVSIGFFVFFFVFWRVFWRLREGFIAPETERPWESRLAYWVHRLTLVALVLLVVTGPLYIFTAGFPINVFGWFEVGLPLESLSFLHEPAGSIHELTGLYLLPALLALHILGAFKHYLARGRGESATGL
ncbi:MAG: cytochrome b [Algiphilus sp.]